MERDREFETHRPRLFSLAYRMLGSVMDAEDMVQETFLRWQRGDGSTVECARSFLTTILTRLCIDHLRSARVRREQYVGVWLPEPLLGEEDATPEDASVLQESISMAFLVLLETLSPSERACFLLHEVFGYAYAEIAGITGESEANCRQLVSRARRRVAEGRPRFPVNTSEQVQLTTEFLHACTDGDTDRLVSILSEDAVVYSDGGGKASAAVNPIRGQDRVARFFIGIMRKAAGRIRMTPSTINGRPGFVATVSGQPFHTMSFEVANGRIQEIRIVKNPDKLRSVSRALGAR
jgi:RNA polymerase sigma-70 factor, ECF subfamily